MEMIHTDLPTDNTTDNTTDTIYWTRCIETPSPTAKSTFFFVQEAGMQKMSAEQISKRQNMESFLIVYVLSGEGYFTYHGKRTRVTAGACFYIDCMEPYAHESSRDFPWQLMWVHFNGATSREYYHYFTQNFSNIFYPICIDRVGDLLRKIIVNTQLKTSYYEATNSGLISALLTEIITAPKYPKKNQPARTSMDEKLDKILHYLQIHFTEDITLEELADMFFISKYYLSREFKKKYGEGINACINLFRVNRGKELLRFTDKRIHEISDMCGVPDTNYFIKLFKAAENMTPSEYRQKWKG